MISKRSPSFLTLSQVDLNLGLLVEETPLRLCVTKEKTGSVEVAPESWRGEEDDV